MSRRTDTAPLEALLTEVKSLRADFNQVARISLGSQLAAVRLQLQEQRIASVAGQLADLRKRVEGVALERTQHQGELKRREDELRSGTSNPNEQQSTERFVAVLRESIRRLQGEEQSLRLQETELSSQMATDQAAWVQVNARLEKLERQLSNSR